MAAILLDVDGVLHVSGHPILGGAKAVSRLREAGHRLRFVTNNTTHSRQALAAEIRSFGVELEDEELQTTPIAAAHALAGKRVLALTMPAIVEDLEGIELVGEGADAVLLGAAYFAAALEVLDYEPGQTWMVGDDVEADIGGASAFGLRSVLVRTGKFREEELEEATVKPDGVIDSIAGLPAWLEEH